MAEKYQVRKFEPLNNSSYQFFEVAVNGKFQFQEFVDNLKDEQRDLKKLNAIYGYMDSLRPSNLLPKTKFKMCIRDSLGSDAEKSHRSIIILLFLYKVLHSICKSLMF